MEREPTKGKEGDTEECRSGLSTGARIGLSLVPYVGGLLAMGAMLADGVDDEGDDCSLEETVETKDTKPSTGGVLGGLFGGSDDEGTKTENTDSSTGDSEENDLFKDDDY